MNMFFLEVAMCEKCRSSHFQLEGGVKVGGGLKNLGTGGVTNLGGVLLSLGGVQYPITCHDKKIIWNFYGSWFLTFKFPKGVIQFLEFQRVQSQLENFQGAGVRKAYPQPPPFVFFFWNSPIVLSKVVLPFKSEGILGMT